MLNDFTIGRKGFLTYLKSLGGSNIVKVVPAGGNASGVRVTDKRLKVVCGTNTSFLDDMAWIGDKTPISLCEVRVSPSNTVSPNLGALELSEALSRVVPFTSKEDTRPVLQCVLFRVADGKLTIVSADGFRLSVVKLDFGSTGSPLGDGDEGQVLINRDELRGVISALRRAYRVRVSFEKNPDGIGNGMSLVLDTELIRYKWRSVDGDFPDYEKLIPAEFNTFVSFDANEAIKAVNSLKILSDSKAYPIDLTIGNGKLTMSSPDDKGQTEIPADTLGDGKIRLDGGYLADALRACGGMVDLKLVDGKSPMLFTSPDYELVVMPMLTNDNQKPTGEEKTAEPEAEVEHAEVEEAEKAQAVAEAEEITKHVVSPPNPAKPKRKHKALVQKPRAEAKEPVAV